MMSTYYFIITTLMLVRTFQCDNVSPVIKLFVPYDGYKEFYREGQKANLECQTTFEEEFVSFQWELSKDWAIASETIEVKNNSGYRSSSTIITENLNVTHGYEVYLCRCKAIHKQWNYTVYSDDVYIRVFKDLEHCNIVLLEEMTSKNFKIPEMTVEVKISYCPGYQTVLWVAPETVFIEESSDRFILSTVRIFEQKFNYVTKFHFKNITTEDFGFYSPQVDGSKTFPTAIYVDLNEKPSIRLSIHNTTQDGKMIVYECMVAANPKPNISWFFHECPMSDCLNDEKYNLNSSFEELNELYHLDNGLQVISYVLLNLSESSGFVRCVSRNSEATEAAFYVENGFDLFVKTGKLENDSFYAGYGEVVDIFCSVSLYDYVKEIRWFINGRKIQKHSIHYSFKNYTNLDKFVEFIAFRFVKEDQSGNYTCEVMNRIGEIHSKNVTLISKQIHSFYPQILTRDLNNGHNIVEGNLTLECKVIFHTSVKIRWKFLRIVERTDTENILNFDICRDANYITSDLFIVNQISVESGVYVTSSHLNITEANENDGYYCCTIEPHDSRMTIPSNTRSSAIYVISYYDHDGFIDFEEEEIGLVEDNNNYEINIFLRSHPEPELQWFDSDGKEILANLKYNILTQKIMNRGPFINYKAILKFNEISYRDFGKYTLVVTNEKLSENYSVEVNLTDLPSVQISLADVKEGNFIFKCLSIGYPEPTLQWYFCSQDNSFCDEDNMNKEVTENILNINETLGLIHISYISVNLKGNGLVTCQSSNTFGVSRDTQKYVNYIIEENVANFADKTDSLIIAEFVNEDEKFIGCLVPTYDYMSEVVWSRNGDPFSSYYQTGQDTSYLTAIYSKYNLPLKISAEEYFSCSALSKDGFLKSKNFIVRTNESFLNIYETNMVNRSVQVQLGSRKKFYCYTTGFPTPILTWYKDHHIITDSEGIKILNKSQELIIDLVTPEDEGVYICETSNKYNKIKKMETLFISDKYDWLYAQMSLLVFVVVFISVLFLLKRYKEKNLEEELRAVGLVYFHKGAVESLNPNLGIDEQADLLPYNTKWEIPFDQIELGKQLGSGAFGVIFEGKILKENKTVAIKTTNPNSGFECVKFLASELKIMAYLGGHMNVVNLLGACTRNIGKRGLYVVLEFCSFGNLLQYLQRRSQTFVDQKNYETDQFDWDKGKQQGVNQELSLICSKDLVTWSFQISQGMKFLSSRKIIHGDLAARNILLADNNVVKVSDFGLSKKMYQYTQYVTKHEGPLPVKWMSIEAIEKGIFSTESDVWSYGIVLWEIFSLGKTPYPGVMFDHNFYKILKEGYRMESPEVATTQIYEIMTKCWDSDPTKRPTFTELCDKIGSFLEEETVHHYVSMNNEYMVMNQQQQDDYLTMANLPDYVNSLVG